MTELPEKIASKIEHTPTCWLWTASITAQGYGQVRHAGRAQVAHRVVWSIICGPIPAGMQLDHRCHVRQCVNPDHLQVVTPGENSENRRGAQPRSTSGVRGVSWKSANRKWVVQVKHHGVTHYGGLYVDLAAAERAAVALRNTLHTNNLRDRALTFGAASENIKA